MTRIIINKSIKNRFKITENRGLEWSWALLVGVLGTILAPKGAWDSTKRQDVQKWKKKKMVLTWVLWAPFLDLFLYLWLEDGTPDAF